MQACTVPGLQRGASDAAALGFGFVSRLSELLPASNDTTFLQSIAASLYKSMAAVDPEAVWMIQGWMFDFDNSFWGPAQIKVSGASVLPLDSFLR
jgi:hypothetical protein